MQLKVTVDATGGITDILIMDGGGSAYEMAPMNVVGIATTTGHAPNCCNGSEDL